MEVKKFSVKGNIRKKVDGGLLTEERDSSGSDSEEDSRRPKNDVSGIKEEPVLVIPLQPPSHSAHEDGQPDEDKAVERNDTGPILARAQPPELLDVINDKERFKLDLELKADDVDFRSSSYKRVPIESFGRAMLLGMGWDGKDSTESKTSSERIVPREARLGLGAASMHSLGISTSGKNPKRPRTSREEDKNITKQIDKKLSKQSIHKGDIVILLDKTYAGKKAIVLETKGSSATSSSAHKMILVKLESSGEILEVSKNDVSLENGKSQMRSQQEMKDDEAATIEESDHKEKKKKRKESNGNNLHDMKEDKNSNSPEEDWLTQGIRVKLITKKLGKENYLQKATVLDVYDKGIASIAMDKGGTIESVKAKHLETVLPKNGGLCLILRGKFKGQMANSLGKESDIINVQTDDGDTLALPLDDVAAFTPQNSDE